jgi:hypothetical protein
VSAAAERILSQRHLNRALLARQLLLERGGMSLPKALERVCGIQAQYAPSTYIGIWTRLEGLTRDQLTRALERRSVVQGTLMRVTIHAVSARDYWPFAVAIRESRRRWVLRVRKEAGGAREMAAAARRLRAEIAGRTMTLDNAVDRLVRTYLGGFGPAPRGDIASWAGLPVADVARALERLELRRFRDEQGEELVDLPRAPLPDPTPRHPSASCRPGTRPCSFTRAEPVCCPRSTALVSSAPGIRIPCPSSSWMVRWREAGGMRRGR